jgi:hypothetical protein
MKAKRGQILIFALVAMAVGMIVISPILYFLESSSIQYLHEINRTTAYYTTDAMMGNILGDIYSGVDVYNQNLSASYNLLNPSNGSGYLNSGYNVSVSINNSITQTLPPPKGAVSWIYLDPGISVCNTSSCNPNYLLGSLGAGLIHNYSIYLYAGNKIEVNWTYYGNNLYDGCGYSYSYYCQGSMQMLYPNGTVIANTARSGSGYSQNNPVTLNFNYTVPANASGNYTIQFKNKDSYHNVPTWWCVWYYQDNDALNCVFSGAGQTDHTWVRVGTMIGGQVYSYQDYMITATAKDKNGRNMVSITAVVRSSPGPLAWWQHQTVEIPGWQITYYQ